MEYLETFRREDRKFVCCWQARKHGQTIYLNEKQSNKAVTIWKSTTILPLGHFVCYYNILVVMGKDLTCSKTTWHQISYARQIFSYLAEIHVSQNLARKTLWNSRKGPLEGVKGKQAQKYRKIPKISPGNYIFQRPFLRGLFLEGLQYSEWFIYGWKFAFQNRLG